MVVEKSLREAGAAVCEGRSGEDVGAGGSTVWNDDVIFSARARVDGSGKTDRGRAFRRSSRSRPISVRTRTRRPSLARVVASSLLSVPPPLLPHDTRFPHCPFLRLDKSPPPPSHPAPTQPPNAPPPPRSRRTTLTPTRPSAAFALLPIIACESCFTCPAAVPHANALLGPVRRVR
jgi:hypothetical protein